MSLGNGSKLRIGSRALAAALLAAALCGCSMPLAELPQSIGGLPAGAPARPETQAAFPAVHDMPPPRQDTLLEPEEQQKVQQELERVRKQQVSRAGVPDKQK